MKILTPLEMIHLEKGAKEQYALSPAILMDEAARGAFDLINKYYQQYYGKILIICGRGNNGGDGLALAFLLKENGSFCLAMGDPSDDSLGAVHLKKCRNSGIKEWSVKEFLEHDSQEYLLVDALFGTGLNRSVENISARIINRINVSPSPVFSLDIPSGINGSTGQIMGTAVKADRTLSFGLPKGGNLLSPGFFKGGSLHLHSLGIPQPLLEDTPAYMVLSEPDPLPDRSENFHKGSVGHLSVIGGSAHYTGAPRFAGEAFLKSGGGYVHMILPDQAALSVTMGLPEAVLHPQEATQNGSLPLKAKKSILEICRTMDMAIIGPGLGREEETAVLFRELLTFLDIPLIIDGDGLTHLAGHENLIRGKNIWLLPHPGEMSRLMACPVQEILDNPAEAVRDASDRYGCPVLLKGPHSLMTSRKSPIFLNPTGDSSLATAGSGDILCGILASCIGMGLKSIEALKCAVYIHGLAGERAGVIQGKDSVLARDILGALPRAVREYRKHEKCLEKHRKRMIKFL